MQQADIADVRVIESGIGGLVAGAILSAGLA